MVLELDSVSEESFCELLQRSTVYTWSKIPSLYILQEHSGQCWLATSGPYDSILVRPCRLGNLLDLGMLRRVTLEKRA
jgi:hypothetical protein